jgi:hypothetical protein
MVLADGALVDAPLDVVDAGGACTTTPDIVIDQQTIAGQLSIAGADFAYANVPGAPSASNNAEIRFVPRNGGAARTFRSIAGLTAVVATSADTLAWARQDVGQVFITMKTATFERALAGEPYAVQALAYSGTTVVGGAFAGTASRAFVASDAFYIEAMNFMPSTIPEIVADDVGDFYGVAGESTVAHWTLAGGAATPSLVDYFSTGIPTSDIAVTGGALYVGLRAAGRTGLHRIPKDQIVTSYAGAPWIAGIVPASIATDGTSLYYIANGLLFRASVVPSGPAPLSLGPVGAGASSVIVDERCVYWVEGGGARIMRRVK